MIVGRDREKWGIGHAFFTKDGENGIPVLVAGSDSDTGDLVIVSPCVRVTEDGSRMFFAKSQYVIRLMPDEYNMLMGIKRGEELPPPVNLDDYELRQLSSVRNPAPVFDFTTEDSPY
ncbi:TPA: hypothetical protein ACIAHZ_004000 [Enterobacter roggenkampii]|uniref:hypothetical protein n=1 Tax=Enterobacter roggenkampii TaxID=1812935 RepID=UPI003785F8D2